MANALWSWLPNLCNNPPPAPFSTAVIWKVISEAGDASGRNWAASILFHGISILCLLQNDAKHSDRKAALQQAQVIFVNRIKGVFNFGKPRAVPSYPHPILHALRLV
eukprot:TRINITY_DN5565_c0_g3_i1.p2 TRINITY_DN5565_c0_g3~~TRINITY_DN5565_c0_g3_i1.p2  ORF type:complete len:107 (-),score=21.72 TRINITY_DN5565_c0_g3_i1:278-598(-)